MKKTVQYFTKEYLTRCADFTSDQIIEFLENYRNLVAKVPEKCQLISLKIEPSLLNAFKQKASLEGSPYQTKIKQLMKEWMAPSKKLSEVQTPLSQRDEINASRSIQPLPPRPPI